MFIDTGSDCCARGERPRDGKGAEEDGGEGGGDGDRGGGVSQRRALRDTDDEERASGRFDPSVDVFAA